MKPDIPRKLNPNYLDKKVLFIQVALVIIGLILMPMSTTFEGDKINALFPVGIVYLIISLATLLIHYNESKDLCYRKVSLLIAIIAYVSLLYPLSQFFNYLNLLDLVGGSFIFGLYFPPLYLALIFYYPNAKTMSKNLIIILPVFLPILLIITWRVYPVLGGPYDLITNISKSISYSIVMLFLTLAVGTPLYLLGRQLTK